MVLAGIPPLSIGRNGRYWGASGLEQGRPRHHYASDGTQIPEVQPAVEECRGICGALADKTTNIPLEVARVMQVRIAKWGNSLAVRLPKAIAEDLGLAVGQPVDVAIERGAVRLKPSTAQVRLSDLVAEAERLGSAAHPEVVSGVGMWAPRSSKTPIPSGAEVPPCQAMRIWTLETALVRARSGSRQRAGGPTARCCHNARGLS